ncbi:MAG: hypothetical protein WDM89_21340 [Rhizomicrobium sp.]
MLRVIDTGMRKGFRNQDRGNARARTEFVARPAAPPEVPGGGRVIPLSAELVIGDHHDGACWRPDR